MILISKYIVPKGFIGITLYPFIFLKKQELKGDKVVINHEQIHLMQQIELLVVFFYLLYGLEWVFKLLWYQSRKKAYENLSFEREAYGNEKNLDYLKSRNKWAFLKYVHV